MQVCVTNPLDMHLHLRDNTMLESVLPFSAGDFIGALIMPNLNPPISSLESAIAYKKRILDALAKWGDISKDFAIKDFASYAKSIQYFHPFLALYVTDNLSPQELEKCTKNGFKILKLYPQGVTTGSERGVKSILSQKMLDLFSVAQDLGMILCLHGESAGEALEREYEFGEIFAYIASHFPRLKIIIEHLSDHRSLPLLDEFSNVYATLTMHHIALDISALVGGSLQPHYFCKPILKRVIDKQALANYALSANAKVSFGSDSAPHTLFAKLAQGAAGIFSAPNLLAQLAEFFDKHNALENLQAFVSDNAMRIYELQPYFKNLPKKVITLEKSSSKIPNVVHINDNLGGNFLCDFVAKSSKDFAKENVLASNVSKQCVIPFRAGEEISWQISQINIQK